MKKHRILTLTLSLALALCVLISSAYAGEIKEVKDILTYDKAVQLVIANDSDIKDLLESVQIAEDLKQQAAQTVNSVRVGTGLLVTDSTTASLLKTVMSLDTSLVQSGYNKKIYELQAEKTVKSMLSSIISTEDNIAYLNSSYTVALKSLANAHTYHSLGVITDSELDEASLSVKKLKSSIDSLSVSLDAAYASLNNALGYEASKRYTIEYNPDFSDFEMNTDLESYISSKLSTDPYLKILDATITNAEMSLNLYVYDATSTDSYKQREYNLNSAERTYKSVKDGFGEGMRRLYALILSEEASNETLALELSLAEKDLETAEIKYDLGLITKLDLENAKLAVTSKEMELKTNTFDHDLNVYMLKNPSMLSS
ncbi:MAG: TolC family protein [Lachnospiraceae bacterium]|nr:TolC family protein [Lachnospiraceae bacterium]